MFTSSPLLITTQAYQICAWQQLKTCSPRSSFPEKSLAPLATSGRSQNHPWLLARLTTSSKMPPFPPAIPQLFIIQIYHIWRQLYIPVLGAGNSDDEDAVNDFLLICTIRAVTGNWLMPPGTPNLGPTGTLDLFIKHFWTHHHILERGPGQLEELQRLHESQERLLLPMFGGLVPAIHIARTEVCNRFIDISSA